MAATQPQFPPTINVIPAGYRWNQEAAKTAAERGSFIRVGAAQLGRRTLSGAVRAWARQDPEENRTIFLLDYRITGTPEAVRAALQYAGLKEADINAALANAITRENYQSTKAAQFNAEIERHKANRRDKPQARGFDWDQILWFGQNIKSAQIGTKAGEARGAVAAGRAGAGDSIAEKLRKLGPSKVLDVSNMDLNTGKGVRSVPAPRTAKSGKFGTNRVPIISNKIDQYIRALELAYGAGAQTEYAADIQQVRQALSGLPAVAGAVRMPSPPRQVGAVIAPAPQFAPAVPRVTTPGRGAAGVATLGGGGFIPIPAMGTLRQ